MQQMKVVPGEKPAIGLGRSHGTGKNLGSLAEMYTLTGDEKFKKWAFLQAKVIKNDAEEWTDEDGTSLTTWRLKPGERSAWRRTDWRTGWCYGTVGMVSGLMDFYDAFPDFRFEDGKSALDVASAALNWIITKRVIVGPGWVFMNMRADGPSENPGWGSGVAGIGYGFMRGYEYHKDTDPELAEVYLNAARKSAIYIYDLLRDPNESPAMKGHNLSRWDYLGRAHRIQPGGFESLNLGLCGGVGGTGRFLMPMAKLMKDKDPELAEKCLKSADVVAGWFKTRSIPCGKGVAWTARPKFGGENTINMAIDYGLTGMVLGIYVIADETDDPVLKELTRKAIDGMISLAVEEGDGYKWPLHTDVSTLPCADK